MDFEWCGNLDGESFGRDVCRRLRESGNPVIALVRATAGPERMKQFEQGFKRGARPGFVFGRESFHTSGELALRILI